MAELTIDQALGEAIHRHNSGRLAEADSIYQQILTHQPNNANVWHLSGMIAHQAGRPDLALDRIRRAIQLNPAAEYFANLGVILSNLRRFSESIAASRRALELNPNLVAARNCLGNALVDSGKIDEGITCYRQALSAQPNFPEAWNNLGAAYSMRGNLAEAESAIRNAIQFRPIYPEAWNNLGNVLTRQRKLDEAIAAYRQALTHRSDYPEALSNIGSALTDKKQFDEAIAACQKAIALRPNFSDAYNNLGSAFRVAKRLDEAVAAFLRSLALNPNVPATHNNLANAFFDQGKLDESIESYRRAIALRPDYANALRNLGNVLQQRGLAGEAIPILRQAMTVDPTDAETVNLLGVALYDRGELEETISSFRRAIEMKPDLVNAYNNLGIALKDLGLLDDAMEAYKATLRLRPDDLLALSNRLYTLHFQPTAEPIEILRRHRDWDRQIAVPLKPIIPKYTNDRSPDRVLRIGYVSPDLRRHSVAFFLLPILEAHIRNVCHVICYATSPKVDHITPRIRAASDGWRDLFNLTDEAAAAMIEVDRIDILVDLSGHTAQNRLPLFACKPAPIQVTYLGYPSTTGMEAMDWRLTDAIADPIGAEEFHTEKLYRLPRTAWCFSPLSGSPAIERAERNEVVFGSFNDLSKINSPFLQVWAEILRRLPQSRLLLKNRATATPQVAVRLRSELELLGISADRLELVPFHPISDQHLTCYNRVDIALDTFPYHGTTTTCEAMWMGVPVVSLAGKTHVSRVGASLLHSVGLDDLVAADSDEYIHIAVRLAKDFPRRRTLRENLRRTMQASPLMDAPAMARDIEAAYRRMWMQWISQ